MSRLSVVGHRKRQEIPGKERMDITSAQGFVAKPFVCGSGDQSLKRSDQGTVSIPTTRAQQEKQPLLPCPHPCLQNRFHLGISARRSHSDHAQVGFSVLLDQVQPPLERVRHITGDITCRFHNRRQIGQASEPSHYLQVERAFGAEMVVQIRPSRARCRGQLGGRYCLIRSLCEQALRCDEDLFPPIP